MAAQQGVFEVSVIGQIHVKLLNQALRRLREFAEHESDFSCDEDVFARGVPRPVMIAETVLRI